MKLKEWLRKNKITPYRLAKMINVTPIVIHNIINGKNYPRYEILIKINKITNGQVTLGDY